MNKDPLILQTLDRLRADLGASCFEIVDHWADDLRAVGIALPYDPTRLVYFSSITGRDDDFFVELENAPAPGKDRPYDVVGRFEHVDYSTLRALVEKHLRG